MKTTITVLLLEASVMFCLGQNNQELTDLYIADQADRQKIGNAEGDLNFISQVSSRDNARLTRVYELLEMKSITTGQDYYHAAMICQHGHTIKDAELTISLMHKAIELDSTVNKWLLAAAIDRSLVRKGKPQIYGTQFYRDENGIWSQPLIDTTIISDQERKKYNVETLQEQRLKLQNLSKTSLFKLLDDSKDIGDFVSFCRNEWLKRETSEYNLSEQEFNDLGYHLMSRLNYEDAYQIFLLNTELYPNAFNTYDSLGECLLKLGKQNEALSAYRRSLELNLQNHNARNVLNNH